MPKFRLTTPVRRSNSRNTNQYTKHKDDLREDFNHRCGYCDDLDDWRNAFYEIDHFVPRGYLKNILIHTYSNLVYSCRLCNRAKDNKWPTKDENVHHNGREGFIDPCDPAYDSHFTRNESGEILPINNKLSRYMYKALMLYKPRHSIIWKIEQIKRTLTETDKYENPDTYLLKWRDKMNSIFHNLLDELHLHD